MSSLKDELKGFLKIAREAIFEMEAEARERLSNPKHPVHAKIQAAKQFYENASRVEPSRADQMADGAAALVKETGWLGEKAVDSRLIRCFQGPLSSHDDFQRIVRNRGGHAFELKPVLDQQAKVGSIARRGASGRDENHDRYDYEILEIWSVNSGSAAIERGRPPLKLI